MNIIVSDKLREYLINKAISDVTVQKVSMKACCGTPSLPTVLEGRPKAEANFEVYNADGLKVYLQKDIRVKRDTLRLDLYGFLFTKEIVVDGVEIL